MSLRFNSGTDYALRTSNLTGLNGTYAWTAQTLTGVGGVNPPVTRDGNNAVVNNGTWGRFVEVPALSCFVMAGSVGAPAQAWRLTGM